MNKDPEFLLQGHLFKPKLKLKLKFKPLIMIITMSKVSTLLSQSINVDSRASSFEESIKRNLQKKVIDVLTDERDKLNDSIFQSLDFTLKTDFNSGLSAITREEAEKRIETAMQYEYQLVFVEVELKERQAIFDKYFKTESDDTSTNKGV